MAATGWDASPQSATADREIVISRVIDAPRELVFEAFTEVRHLSRWWGPEGFTTTTRAFELRVGGDDVQVSVDDQGRLARVAALHARDDAGASRVRVEQPGFESECAHVLCHIGGGLSLAFRLALAIVGRVESDQISRDDGGAVQWFLIGG